MNLPSNPPGKKICAAMHKIDGYERTDRIGDFLDNIVPHLTANTEGTKKVGEGSYGCVYPLDVKGFVVKCIEIEGECGGRRAVAKKAEGVVSLFLTKRIITKHCPNFCATAAYIVGKIGVDEKVGFVDDEEDYTMLIFLERAGTDAFRFFARCAISGDLVRMVSVILQILFAIQTMDLIGLRHNDLKLSNILITACDQERTIRYQLGDGKAVLVKTCGVFATLTDFGLSTTDEWSQAYDAETAILNCDPRVAHSDDAAGSISGYYIDDSNLKRRVPRSLLFKFDVKRRSMTHGLAYVTLPPHLRDLASFMSDVYWWTVKTTTEKNNATEKVGMLALGVLSVLSEKKNTQSTIKTVATREWLSSYLEQPDQVLAPPERRRGVVSVYLPEEKESFILSAELCASLGKAAKLNTFIL